MNYVKQFDSIRAIAVTLVIVEHWLPKLSLDKRIPFGEIGVDVFFVLSGFLISGILFQKKVLVESGELSYSMALRYFYIRRTLRIFPIYYLVIGLAYIFQSFTHSNISESFVWYASYTSNWYMFLHGWDGYLAHMWSLAVEEQFYLIWPWIILFVPSRLMTLLLIAFIISGVVSNWLLVDLPMSSVMTFTSFDSFGLGALLAWMNNSKIHQPFSVFRFSQVVGVLSLMLLMIGLWRFEYNILPLRTLISLCALWLIAYVLQNKDKATLKGKLIFNNRFLIFIGKISYGIYIYHNFIPLINKYTLSYWLDPLFPQSVSAHLEKIHFIENCLLLLLVACLSYNLIEKKLLMFKKYFDYR